MIKIKLVVLQTGHLRIRDASDAPFLETAIIKNIQVLMDIVGLMRECRVVS